MTLLGDVTHGRPPLAAEAARSSPGAPCGEHCAVAGTTGQVPELPSARELPPLLPKLRPVPSVLVIPCAAARPDGCVSSERDNLMQRENELTSGDAVTPQVPLFMSGGSSYTSTEVRVIMPTASPVHNPRTRNPRAE